MNRIDLCIVGSGPSSLLAVLEAGLLNLRCHVVNGFDHDETTTSAPSLSDKHLSEILMEQIQIFNPVFSANEWIKSVIHQDDIYHIVTCQNTEIQCRSLVVVI